MDNCLLQWKNTSLCNKFIEASTEKVSKTSSIGIINAVIKIFLLFNLLFLYSILILRQSFPLGLGLPSEPMS